MTAREDLFDDLRRDVADFPTGEISVESSEVAALLDAYDDAQMRTSLLTLALIGARVRVLAIGREGWDSTRSRLLADALTAIDRTLEGRPHGEQ